MTATMDPVRSRKVLMGTCGWSDHSLLRCGRFYPASVRSAEDRLRHYSLHFPCVEVDTSTYAIPSPVSISKWVNAVIPGFLFHFKAFGLFCSKSGNGTTIPHRIRSKLQPPDREFVRLQDLSSEIRDELWYVFNSALQPAYKAGCLGVVIFQFHLSFKPSENNRTHVLWCRENLDSRYSMAVEFRCRDWFVGEQMSKTESWLAPNGISLISADELEHETFQRDRQQTGLAPGQLRAVLPIAWPSISQDFLYIRVHRREGTQRVLSDEELESWAMRLGSQLPPGFQGPIYFMWGTDWEDQPLINAKRLSERLPKELIFDWKSIQRTNNRLQNLFMAVSKKLQQSSHADESHERAEDSSSCLSLTTGFVGNLESTRNSLQVQESALDGEGGRTKSPPSEQSADTATTPIPEFAHNEKSNDMPIDEEIVSKMGVELRMPPARMDGPDVSLLLKAVPRKLTGFSPKKGISKKPIQPKKPRLASHASTITSFFKQATPKNL